MQNFKRFEFGQFVRVKFKADGQQYYGRIIRISDEYCMVDVFPGEAPVICYNDEIFEASQQFNRHEHHSARLFKAASAFYFIQVMSHLGKDLKGEERTSYGDSKIREELFAALVDYSLNEGPLSKVMSKSPLDKEI